MKFNLEQCNLLFDLLFGKPYYWEVREPFQLVSTLLTESHANELMTKIPPLAKSAIDFFVAPTHNFNVHREENYRLVIPLTNLDTIFESFFQESLKKRIEVELNNNNFESALYYAIQAFLLGKYENFHEEFIAICIQCKKEILTETMINSIEKAHINQKHPQYQKSRVILAHLVLDYMEENKHTINANEKILLMEKLLAYSLESPDTQSLTNYAFNFLTGQKIGLDFGYFKDIKKDADTLINLAKLFHEKDQAIEKADLTIAALQKQLKEQTSLHLPELNIKKISLNSSLTKKRQRKIFEFFSKKNHAQSTAAETTIKKHKH